MKFYLMFLLCIPTLLVSQTNIEKTAARINSIKIAEAYIKNSKNKTQAKLVTFSKDDTNNVLINSLFELPRGKHKIEQTEKGKILYKVIQKKTGFSYKANIMEFNSNKTTIAEINSLRSFIMKGLKSKEHKFENLARVYSSHKTAKTGGDLGWTKAGTFSKRFEKAIADKRVGQVFSFDEHRKRKHYVIMKTAKSKPNEYITVFIISEH